MEVEQVAAAAAIHAPAPAAAAAATATAAHTHLANVGVGRSLSMLPPPATRSTTVLPAMCEKQLEGNEGEEYTRRYTQTTGTQSEDEGEGYTGGYTHTIGIQSEDKEVEEVERRGKGHSASTAVQEEGEDR